MTAQHRFDPGRSAPAADLIDRVRRRQASTLPTFRGDLPIPRLRDRVTSAGGAAAAGVYLPDPTPAASSTSYVIPFEELPCGRSNVNIPAQGQARDNDPVNFV